MSALTMNASWAQCFSCVFAAGDLRETAAERVHMEDSDGVCSVVSKNYIQVIVFYLLAQTKVIYIYKPINKVS